MGGDNRSPENIERFLNWLKTNEAYINPNVDIFNLRPDGQHGAKAMTDIKNDECLLAIPKELALFVPYKDEPGFYDEKFPSLASPAALAAMRQLNPEWVMPGASQSDNLQATILLLMAEKARGHWSNFAPYINILPTLDELNLLHLWPKETRVQLLKGTGLEDSGVRWPEMYLSKIIPYVAAFPKVWPKEVCTLDMFKWAYCIVRSRGNLLDNDQSPAQPDKPNLRRYLIPAVDMLNHSSFPEQQYTDAVKVTSVSGRGVSISVSNAKEPHVIATSYQSDDENDSTDLEFPYGVFQMKAEKDIPAGTEITVRYTKNGSDADFVDLYGFIQEPIVKSIVTADGTVERVVLQNPNNTIYVDTENMMEYLYQLSEDPGMRDCDARIDYLDANGGLETEITIKRSAISERCNTEIFTGILTFLQVLMMSPKAFQRYKKVVAARGGDIRIGTEYLNEGPPEFAFKVMKALKLGIAGNLKEIAESRKANAAAAGVGSKQQRRCALWLQAKQHEGLTALLKSLMELPDQNESYADKSAGGDSENIAPNSVKAKGKKKKGGKRKT